jgi:hypothetical protein
MCKLSPTLFLAPSEQQNHQYFEVRQSTASLHLVREI